MPLANLTISAGAPVPGITNEKFLGLRTVSVITASVADGTH